MPTTISDAEMPVIFLSHGAGPAWLLDGNQPGAEFAKGRDANSPSADFMRDLRQIARLPRHPKAILVISGHWEEAEHTVSTSLTPNNLYFDFDYYGVSQNLPPEALKVQWPAPRAYEMALRTKAVLQAAGITCLEDGQRGLDHGVFVPLKLAYPEADVPVFQVSLKGNLDIADHLRLGEALAPLRREGVLIIGSGSSSHPDGDHRILWPWQQQFSSWLKDVVSNPDDSASQRKCKLLAAHQEETFAVAHPRIEHFLPACVAVAAAGYAPAEVFFEVEQYGGAMLPFTFGYSDNSGSGSHGD